MKTLTATLFIILSILNASAAIETVFADYFDIKAGSRGGSRVLGRLNPLRNKDVADRPIPDSYRFELAADTSGIFEVRTERDSDGRIYGAILVKNDTSVPTGEHTFGLDVSLFDGREQLARVPIEIHCTQKTLWTTLYERYAPGILNNQRLHGNRKPSDSEVAADIEELEANGGRFAGERCYTAHPADYPATGAESTIEYDWIRVANRIGGLGYAYATSAVYGPNGNQAKRDRLRDALYSAIVTYTDAVPVEGGDVEIDGKPIGRLTGDGFSLLQKHKLMGIQVPTHQWLMTDPLVVPAVYLMPDIMAGMAEGDPDAIAVHRSLVRYMQIFMSIVEARRAIDNPDQRWGEIQNLNYSSGAWADANLGHRSRTMLALPLIWADYNRPITYVQYWYSDFYPDSRPEGFSFSPGWSPHGVVADAARWMTKNDIPTHRYAQSGYQPDGTISHHIGHGTDAAMVAYGFEWLTEFNTGFRYFAATPYEIPGRHMQFELDRLVDVYPLLFYRGHMDYLVSGRTFLTDLRRFVSKNYVRAAKALLNLTAGRDDIHRRDELKNIVRKIKDGRHETSATTPFWVNEFLVHRRGGENPFYASVKLKSQRTVGAEDFDRKVRHSWHAGYGITSVKVTGDEYAQPVLARYDWHALPGLTEEWRTDPLPLKGGSQASLPGANTIAGVLGDSVGGMAIYHHLPAETYSSATAFKTYNFIGNRLSAQGNGVSRVRSGQGRPIATFVEQGAMTSPLTIGINGDIFSIAPGESVDTTFTITAPVWSHSGRKGYVVMPRGSTQLQIVTGDYVNVTDPAGKVVGKEHPGFIIAIIHGADPEGEDGSYTYTVTAGVDADDMPDELKRVVENFTFVTAGTNAHALYAADERVWRYSFFGPGEITAGGVTVKASHAAQLMLRDTETETVLAVNNPAPDHTLRSLSFVISRPLAEGKYPYRIGGIYPVDGESVTISPDGHGSRITVELPDSRDEARYNYQTELYSAAPIVIRIPQ